MKSSGQKLDQKLKAITQNADTRNLIVCSQMVAFPTDADDGPAYPFLDWEGDDAEYVAMAAKAGARIFYVSESMFSCEASLIQLTADAGYREVIEEDGDEADEPDANPEPGSASWMLDRLRDRTTAWTGREGEIWAMQCVWFAEGVAHTLQHFADWYFDFRKAAQDTIDEAQELRDDGWRAASEADERRINERSEELARHPRFSEATSEAKRVYMAHQVFANADPIECQRIAAEATLAYWWTVEPAERATKTQRIRELQDAGESLIDITATLKMSREKVKALLLETAAGGGEHSGDGPL